MAAITSVDVENFRCFKKLRVEGLAAVNLIVGANNSGKTVLLEAIEAVVSRDSRSCSTGRRWIAENSGGGEDPRRTSSSSICGTGFTATRLSAARRSAFVRPEITSWQYHGAWKR